MKGRKRPGWKEELQTALREGAKDLQIPLEKVITKVTIEAVFETDTFDNGAAIDDAIEKAIAAVAQAGRVRVAARTLLGVPKHGGSHATRQGPARHARPRK